MGALQAIKLVPWRGSPIFEKLNQLQKLDEPCDKHLPGRDLALYHDSTFAVTIFTVTFMFTTIKTGFTVPLSNNIMNNVYLLFQITNLIQTSLYS